MSAELEMRRVARLKAALVQLRTAKRNPFHIVIRSEMELDQVVAALKQCNCVSVEVHGAASKKKGGK